MTEMLLSHVLLGRLALILEVIAEAERKTCYCLVIKSTALDLGTPGFEPHICCGLTL